MNSGTLLGRLLAEIKQDTNHIDNCLWCGRASRDHIDTVAGYTWHADDCAYLAAHLYVAAADRVAELKDGFARIADLAAKDGDA